MKTLEMEIALAEHFNARVNLIVTNIHWGMFIHEMDLLVLTKAGYASEVEIKVSRADLVKDKEKRHGHFDSQHRIKHLYFAIPEKLRPHIEHIPERAGIIIVSKSMGRFGRYTKDGYETYEQQTYPCDVIRQPQVLSKYKFSEKERYNMARLGAMRIWTMKKKILKATQ